MNYYLESARIPVEARSPRLSVARQQNNCVIDTWSLAAMAIPMPVFS